MIPAMAVAAAAIAAAVMQSRTAAEKKHKHPNSSYLFIGDIGGTNTRLSLYKPNSNKPIASKEFLNSTYFTDATKTFEDEIFLPFLSTCDDVEWDHDTVVIACFAVAGPVRNNCVTMTNLGETPIKLDGNSIEKSNHGILKYIRRCKVVNDFVGQGYGLLDLDLDKEVVELTPGSKAMMDPHGPKACAGAGTGLGECFLTQSSLHPSEGYECYASEGGHVDFVPRDDLQVQLLNYLKNKFGAKHRVSVERVVSGRGLANCYEFLSKTFPKKANKDIQTEFEGAKDMQGRVVGMNANSKDNPDKLCVQAMEIMMSAYGAEVGNCGVKFIPTGGLYVSGGLTPKNIKFITGQDSPFMKAYKDKGRLSTLLESIPLFAVLVEDLGLRGARVCALREFNNY